MHDQASKKHDHNIQTPQTARTYLQKRKLLMATLGLLTFLLIGAGLLTALQLIGVDQSLIQRANVDTVDISMSPASVTLAADQETTINLVADTGVLTMSAAKVVLHYDNELFSILEITPSNAFSVVLEEPIIDNENGTATLTLGTTPNNALNGQDTFASVRIQAKSSSGTADLRYDGLTEVAAFGSSTNRASIAGRSTVAVQGSNTDEPGDSIYQLTMNYRLDGVNEADIEMPTEIALRYDSNGEEQVKVYNRIFRSNSDNEMVITATPLDKDFDIADADGQIEILIKPENGLRTTVGTLPTTAADMDGTVISADFTDRLLGVGDVEHGNDNENRINLQDISSIVRNLGDEADSPVQSDNRRADLDHNQVINIDDLSYLLESYTEVNVKGEEL